MFKDKQVTEKTKTSFSTKMLVSVALLIGVSVGGYLLNMAGAASTCTADNCTVLSKLASVGLDITNTVNSATSQITTKVQAGQWTVANNISTLYSGIKSGKDVKVSFSIDSGKTYINVNCSSVTAASDLIECDSTPTISYSDGTKVSKTEIEYIIHFGVVGSPVVVDKIVTTWALSTYKMSQTQFSSSVTGYYNWFIKN